MDGLFLKNFKKKKKMPRNNCKTNNKVLTSRNTSNENKTEHKENHGYNKKKSKTITEKLNRIEKLVNNLKKITKIPVISNFEKLSEELGLNLVNSDSKKIKTIVDIIINAQKNPNLRHNKNQ